MQIFSAPSTIPLPDISKLHGYQEYQEAENKYVADLKLHLQMNGYNSEHVGEVVAFPVADGSAKYMVASIKPLKLIHLPLMDEYEYPYIDRLKAVDILEKINQQKAMAKLFK
jgi:hypothetical protein